PVGGPYAVGVRRCFLDGVLSGQPVEFLTRDHGTEGEEVLTLYRFAGQGPIISYDRDGGRWTYSACGISPVTGQLVFQRDGLCDRRDLESGA
ncbi:MAG: hypothetical protein ACJ77D_02130, partial [Chloroflexota bacterium]